MTTPDPVLRLADQLAETYRLAQDQVDTYVARIADDPRYWRQRARYRAVNTRIDLLLDRADDDARAWVKQELPRAYMAGGQAAAAAFGSDFAWTVPHREAIAVAAQDTYGDLLKATRYMRKDAKALIREIVRSQVATKLAAGDTAVGAGRKAAQRLAARGVTAVVYRNGARHGIGSYGPMVLRTKTAEAYNQGMLRSMKPTQYVEVSDGIDCGWLRHDDLEKANGMIMTVKEARTVTISHPNCVRSFMPRPDITTKAQAKAAESSVDPASRADQIANERERQERARARQRRLARQRRRRATIAR